MSVSASEFRQALQILVDKLQGETSQRNQVVKSLAVLGHRAAPKVVAGRLDGASIRIYVWEGTPAGDVMLATGPSFLPKILAPSDIQQSQPGIYVLAAPDTTKAGASVSAYAQGYKPKPVREAVQKAVRAAPPRERAKAERAVSKVAHVVAEAPRPSAASVEADERKELQSALAALLG